MQNHIPPNPELEALLSTKVRAGLIQQLYRQGFGLVYLFPFTIVVLYLVLSSYVPAKLLVPWLLVILAFAACRLILTRKFEKKISFINRHNRWENAYLILELLSGVSVGMSMAFVIYLNPYYQMAIYLLIVGTTTGSVAMLAPSFKVNSAYILTNTTTGLGWLFYLNEPYYLLLAIMGLAHAVLMLISSFKLGKTLEQSFFLRFQNEELLKEKNLMNEELKISQAQLEEAYSAKSLFLSNMSHEIRTPLNAIMGAIQLLQSNKDPSRQSKMLAVASTATEGLLSLLNNLLDLSRNEAQQQLIERIPFNLPDLMTEVSDILKLQAQKKDLDLTCSIGYRVPEDLIGDPLRIKQILNNLGANAIKFTREGHIELRVSEINSDNHRTTLLFEVEDTGIGIDPSRQNDIFNAFTQADSSTTREYGGSGLGLAIVKQLSIKLGGSCSVDSRLDRGSTFRVKIPLRKNLHLSGPSVAATAKPASGTTISESQTLSYDKAQLNILLVEDNDANRLVALWTLEQLGIAVDCAENGVEALEMMDKSSYEVILMDCQMPIKDGFETTREIRTNEKSSEHVIIIAMTANAAKGDKERCLSAGMDGYISKPIKTDSLREEIAKFLPQQLLQYTN